MRAEQQSAYFARGVAATEEIAAMPDVLKATNVEVRIVHLLRARIEKAIAENGSEWAAAELDISLPGVEAILWRHDWSVGTAVHLASRLGVLTESDLDKLDDTQPVAS